MIERIQTLQQLLKETGIGAAVMRLPENIVMFTHYFPVNGISTLLVPDHGEPLLIVPHGDTSFIRNHSIKFTSFGWSRLSDGDPNQRVREIMLRWIQENHIGTNILVAVEKGFEQVSPALCSGESLLPGETALSIIRDVFGAKELTSLEVLISRIRPKKNGLDIKRLQIANKIAKQGLHLFAKMIRPGVQEIDIAAEVESHIAKIASSYSDVVFARAWAQVSSGTRTVDAYYPGMVSSSREIHDGDLVMIELGTVVDGFWSDLTRVSVAGTVGPEARRMIKIVQQAYDAAKSVVRPGALAKDVDAAAREIIEQAGFGEFFVHHTGHGVGFRYHEPVPYIAPGSNDVLDVGMVHSIEPGIYVPGVGGVRYETNVLVTENGVVEL